MKRKIISYSILGAVILCFALFIKYGCRLTSLEVSGSTYYTEDEFKDFITTGRFADNTIYQYLRLRFGRGLNIPFVEQIEVDYVNLNTLKVNIYEKKIIGCIPYMGEYICFDKDGVMVGSVLEKREDIPSVTGIDYKKMIYNETVDTEQKDIFDVILNIAQLVDKNKIRVERVDIDSEREITLYLGDIKVKLGKHDQYDEPLAALPGILKGAEGLKGTLNMENYTEGNTEVIFVKDGD